MTDARPNIILITTDQQRFDSLGCNGNPIIRTPAVDSLAAAGVRYERAHTQNVLCTPSRVTMVTGQHPFTHGVWCNGVDLPLDRPTVMHLLQDAGYATALLGKIHFESFATFDRYREGREPGSAAPERGLDRLEYATHFPVAGEYATWLRSQLGESDYKRYRDSVWSAFKSAGGDTGAPQSLYASLEPSLSTSAWVVDRALSWLDERPADKPFFAWVSFPDPHHPFVPPAAYGRRHRWQDLPLPPARPASRAAIEAELAAKPWQYLAYWKGDYDLHEGSLNDRPGDLTDDQVRELTALTYGMVELIDDQVGRLLAALAAAGLDSNTHIFFTTDHGEFLGDHGLLFKGPFHLDPVVRLPLVWRPPTGRTASGGAVVSDPVGLVDLAPTFCRLAGIDIPAWMDGAPLPASDGHRDEVLTVFDSSYREELQLRSIFRDGWLATAYPRLPGVGELYDTSVDPHQYENRWSDPAAAIIRDDLVARLAEVVRETGDDERLAHSGHHA